MPSAVSLNIKNPDVHAAASQLARLQGTTITDAVLAALTHELARLQSSRQGKSEAERMEQYAMRITALPVLDTRTDDEILGYGPDGHLDGD